MVEAAPTSPLASMTAAFYEVCAQSDAALTIRERPFCAQVTLRVEPGSVAALAVADALGLRLPRRPCTVESQDALDALWLGPNEWLLVSSERTAAELERKVRAALTVQGGSDPVSVVDVSAQRTIIELSGPAARTVLAKGCALDLHESVFSAGQCVQTLLARAPVIVQPMIEADTIRVFVRPSFATYLAAWLLDASFEERSQAASPVNDELALRAR